jgi:hypothetical protein
MDKRSIKFGILILLIAFLLQACGGNTPSGALLEDNGVVVTDQNHSDANTVQSAQADSSENQAAAANDATEAEISELPVIAAPIFDGPLPDIPEVTYAAGESWFKPTDPSSVVLASGKLQFIKFSAVW